MTTNEKLLKAKAQLILEQPFFATLALQLKYVPNESVKTAITNGKQLSFNPSYIDSLSIEQVKGVMAHEVMHNAMLHHTRRNNRNPKRWNDAADHAINPLLLKSGFKLPNGALFNKAYESLHTEKIYELLFEQPPSEDGNQDDQPGGTGDVEDLPREFNVQEQEMQVKQMLAQAAMVARRQGKLPAHLDRMVQEALKPRICWQEILARFLAEIVRNDYNWKKPSPRYLSCGLYLPVLESEQAGKLILLVDTSMSIDRKLMDQFAGEAQDIANTFHIGLQVIYVDADVCGLQDIDADEPLQLHPKGGGGTDFRPGFVYITENDLAPKAVVYLTDGECKSFPETPDYPVLWAQFGAAQFDPPFGEVIQVIPDAIY